jgi:hypothetical protein
MKKVYIAGKLNDDAVGYISNMHRMIKTAGEVKKAGYSVFVPCLDILMGLQLGWESYDDYFDNSQGWLQCSDAVFLVPGWESSHGTKREIVTAEQNNIPVFEDLDDMNAYFKNNEHTD